MTILFLDLDEISNPPGGHMENFYMAIHMVDRGARIYDQPTGRELINAIVGDVSPPPRDMVIRANLADGRKVSIHVSYDERTRASVEIEEPE